jgi:uncharacterized membrane protein
MTRDDRVLPATRLLSAVIVPFLVVAFVVLYGFPTRTDDLFAWTITPPMTPMMLGAVYLGGAYFFVRAYRVQAWHALKSGFLAVGMFASLMGVATVVHWDKFNHSHVAFWLWAGLYFTTPFLVGAALVANQRTERPASIDELRVPAVARVVFLLVGAAAVAMGAYLFLFPTSAIDVWPWLLTPLTARVLGAIFMLGLAALSVAADPRWTAARLMLQVEAFMMALILLGAARAHDDFDTSRPLTWLLLGGFAATLVGAVAFSRAMDARAATAEPRTP